MKKKLALLLAGAMLMGAALTGCGGTSAGDEANSGADAPAASGDTQADGGTLRMLTNAAFPPYEFVGDDGEVTGIDAEIAQAVADKLGMKLEITDMAFESLIAGLQSDAGDIILAGMTVNDERKQSVDFTDSYATGVQVVIVPENTEVKINETKDGQGNTVKSVDLTGLKIGVQTGTTGDLYCSSDPEDGGYGEDAVQRYDNGALAVAALKNGQVDCVVIDNEPAKSFVAANSGLKILDTAYTVEDYAAAVKKGNTELLDKVNGALAELKEDGAIDSIIAKYIHD
ncbi:MAG: transporter substrate-binding domain-containing protein [Intestinibacillus sp.]